MNCSVLELMKAKEQDDLNQPDDFISLFLQATWGQTKTTINNQKNLHPHHSA